MTVPDGRDAAEATVRRATRDDAAALLPLVREAHALHAAALPWYFRPAGDASLGEAEVQAALSRAGHLWLVARRGQRAVGYASAEERREPPTPYKQASAVLHVHAMAVTAAERGRGVGRVLMAALRAAAAERGLEGLTLEVYAFNERAHAFYAREGFAPLRALLLWRAGDGVGGEPLA